MCNSRCASSLVCYWVVQTALSWVGVYVGSNKTIRILYCHDSDASILHYPVMQAGRSGNAIFYTRSKHALIFGCSAPECFIFRDLFYMLVLFSSDCHSPDLTPVYDRPSTDQASSAILSLYSHALAVASSMACHNTGINLQDGRRSDCTRLF